MAARTQEEILKLLFQVSGDDDVASLAKALADLGKSADGSGDKARKLLDELQKLGSTADGIQKFTRLKGEIAETGTKIVETSQRLQQLRREIDASAQPNDKLAKSFDRTQAELDKLMRLQNRQSAELTRTAGVLRKAGVDTDQLGAAYDKLQGRMGAVGREAQGLASGVKRVGDEQGKAAGSASRLKKATDDAGASVAGLTKRLTKVSAATAAASAAMLAFGGARLFKGAVDSSLEFEAAMSQVQAVSGATGDELQALRAAAEAGGLATKFSALEAAAGLGELARATGSARSAIAALPATLNLAQASGIGVAEAAQFITTTLAQFGLDAAEAARVADVLALAANASTADVQGLGNSLTYAAPLAKQLGLDLEETTAIIGALADQGFRCERAGTALRNVFTEMQDPASAFAKALRDMGIDTTDFVDVLDALAKGGPVAQRALLNLDAAARPAILALVNGGVDGLHRLEEALRSSAGSAEATASAINNNAGGAIETLREVYDKAQRDLADPLLEPLREELLALSGELATFAQSPEFSEIKEALEELFIEGAQAVRDFAKEVDFAELATSIRDFVDDSRGNLAQFRESITEVANVISVLGDTVGVIVDAIQAAIFAMATALTGIISLVAKAALKLSEPQRKLMEFLGVSTQGFQDFEDFAGGMNAVAEGFAERTEKNFDELVDGVANFGSEVKTSGAAATEALQGAADASGAAAAASSDLGVAGHTAADGLNAQAAAAQGAAGATDAAAQEAEAAAARIRAAFADLGIKSREDLDQTATAAKRSFELIAGAVRDGQRPVDDARAAFVAYGRAALDAVRSADDSVRARVSGELAVQASIYGVSDALEELGLVSGEVGRAVGDNMRRAVPPLREVESAARGAAQATADVASGAGGAANGLRAMGAAAGTTVAGVIQLNDALLQAFAAVSKYAGAGPRFANNFNVVAEEMIRQRDSVMELNAELDQQIAKIEPLSKELQKLKLQYKFVDDATLQQIADKQIAIKQERQRAADERRQLRQERNESAADAGSQDVPAPSAGSRARSLESGRVYVVELRAGEDSVRLPVQGDATEFERFMQNLRMQRSTATGGRS
jgi:TP901 family phage tail tape measure protein